MCQRAWRPSCERAAESTAYAWLRRGDLPGAIQLGGRWYVRRRVVQAWLDGDVSSATAAA